MKKKHLLALISLSLLVILTLLTTPIVAEQVVHPWGSLSNGILNVSAAEAEHNTASQAAGVENTANTSTGETESPTAFVADTETEVSLPEADTATDELLNTTGVTEDSTSSPAASTTPNAPPPSTAGDEDEIPAGLIIVTLILTVAVAVGGVIVTVALGRIAKGKK